MSNKANPKATLFLRLSLTVAFGYAGVGSLLEPAVWIGYLPSFVSRQSFAPTLLMFFSVIELGLAAWLLSGWKTKFAAILAGLMLTGIVLANISDLTIVFRDLALIFSAIALFLLYG